MAQTAEGVGRVLYHAQAVAAGKGVNLFQLPGVAGVVHGHDGDGAGGQAAGGVFQVQGARFGQRVAGHGTAARSADGLKGGHKGQAGHQHFRAAVFDGAAGGHGVHSQVQGGRAGVGGDHLCGLHAQVSGQFFFNAAHFRAQIAVFQQHARHGARLRLAHNGPGQTHGRHTASLWGLTHFGLRVAQ